MYLLAKRIDRQEEPVKVASFDNEIAIVPQFLDFEEEPDTKLKTFSDLDLNRNRTINIKTDKKFLNREANAEEGRVWLGTSAPKGDANWCYSYLYNGSLFLTDDRGKTHLAWVDFLGRLTSMSLKSVVERSDFKDNPMKFVFHLSNSNSKSEFENEFKSIFKRPELSNPDHKKTTVFTSAIGNISVDDHYLGYQEPDERGDIYPSQTENRDKALTVVLEKELRIETDKGQRFLNRKREDGRPVWFGTSSVEKKEANWVHAFLYRGALFLYDDESIVHYVSLNHGKFEATLIKEGPPENRPHSYLD